MTDFRSSQVAGEVWTSDDPQVRVSQVAAEAWVRSPTVTSLIVSQARPELWGANLLHAAPEFVASQVFAEVWCASPVLAVPTARRYPPTSQVV